MTNLKPTTKQAQNFIHSYKYYCNKNNGESLYQIYGNFSDKKYNAFLYCLKLKEDLNGFKSCFCGHNCDFFTYAFLFIEDDRKYLAYITHGHNYKILYEEE